MLPTYRRTADGDGSVRRGVRASATTPPPHTSAPHFPNPPSHGDASLAHGSAPPHNPGVLAGADCGLGRRGEGRGGLYAKPHLLIMTVTSDGKVWQVWICVPDCGALIHSRVVFLVILQGAGTGDLLQMWYGEAACHTQWLRRPLLLRCSGT